MKLPIALMLALALVSTALRAGESHVIIPSLEKYDSFKAKDIQMVVRATGGNKGPIAELGRTLTCHLDVSEFVRGRKGKTHFSTVTHNGGKPTPLALAKGSGITGLEEVLHGYRAGADLAIVFPAHMNLGATTFKGIPEKTAVLIEIKILKIRETPAPRPTPKFPDIKDDDPRWETRESGLRILWIKKGDGAAPQFGNKVQVGWAGFVTSTQHLFDKSDSGAWLPHEKGRSFRGYEEAVSLLKVGDEVVIQVPPSLGYAQHGYAPLKIPPNAWLTLTLTLKGVK